MTRGLFDALAPLATLRRCLLITVLGLGLAGCEARISSHGQTIDVSEIDQIIPGETTRFDLESILGRPSIEGAFDSGKVYYISDVMIEPAAGKKRNASRTMFIFTLDGNDIVREIEVRDETSGNTIAHLDDKTPTPGDTFGIADQLFSTLRRRPN